MNHLSKLAIGLFVPFFLAIFLFPSLATAASLTLVWDANTETDLAGYYLHYGTVSRGTQTNPTVFSYATKVDVGNVTTIPVSGLADNTTYYFSVTAYDTSRNESQYSANEASAMTPPVDNTAPLISAVSASNLMATSAQINWTTNEASNTQVEYGLTATYGSSTTLVANLVTSHVVSLSGLAEKTLYHYRVKSRDAASNLATSGDFTFTTLDVTAPVRSNAQPSGSLAAGTTQTTISLTTNEVATCKYSSTAGVAYASMSNTFSSTNSMSHSNLITGLMNGQSKNYYVRCIDSSNNANSSDFLISFSINMPANTPPVISSFSANLTSGVAPLAVSFTCNASDSNNDTLTYSIDFGEGSPSAGASASHTYLVAGNYSAKCTVNDGNGGSDMEAIAISVSAPITPTPTATATASPTPSPTATPAVDQQGSNALSSSNYSVSGGGCGQTSSGQMLAGFALILMLLGFRRRETSL